MWIMPLSPTSIHSLNHIVSLFKFTVLCTQCMWLQSGIFASLNVKPHWDFHQVKYDMTSSCSMCVITREEFEKQDIKHQNWRLEDRKPVRNLKIFQNYS